ncbi:MAG: alanine dehydrogenase, partial [Syntrophobacteraceae bacterium CG07_land_8_20_14_0_80_61_8]
MKIGVLKETKPEEYRVPLVPAGAAALIERGHSVWVQAAAGVGAGFADEAYRQAGAELVATAADVYAAADLLLKVKEPTPPEFAGFRTGQALFCYLHSETRPQLVDLLLERQLTAIAFENVRASDGSLPLLAPMSIIA